MSHSRSASTTSVLRRLGTIGVSVALFAGATMVQPPIADAGDPSTVDIVVLGGTSAVSGTIEAQLRSCTVGSVTRLSGSDRYQTATATSRSAFSSASRAYVATGLNFPDALAGGAAAAQAGQPILLVGDTLPGTTAAELQRLGVKDITVLGGSAGVSQSVAAQLGQYGKTTRISGSDRYATAASIVAATFPSADVVYISTGQNFPDALAGVPAAFKDGAPILLVQTSSIPAPTANQLARLKPSTIKILGGTAVISASVATSLSKYASNVVRLSGGDRYSTAAAISRDAFAGGASTIYITTGDNYPDALAAGPAAGIQGGPILLVQKGAVPSPTRTEIERLTGNSCSAIPPAGALTFTVAGDVGASDAATATLGLIADLAPFAHFVTGDLSYNELKPESGWCGYVRGIVGPSLPFELISGNHEDDGAGAEIRNFTKCLPDRLGAVGDYGVQYYTRLAGRVRIIAISPDLTVDGTAYTYKPGTSERTWLESAVAGARAQGEWVVIMHHKVCINAGEKSCNIGEELANWEAANADVVVMAHSHTYQRSYQLSCVNAGTVTKSCIADKDGDHQQGNGAVFVINGVGGKGNRPVNRSDSEAGYFAALLGTGDKDNGHGVMQFAVTPTTLTGTFIGSDTSFTDSFTIRR